MTQAHSTGSSSGGSSSSSGWSGSGSGTTRSAVDVRRYPQLQILLVASLLLWLWLWPIYRPDDSLHPDLDNTDYKSYTPQPPVEAPEPTPSKAAISRAKEMMAADDQQDAILRANGRRPFSLGTKPVIRWIKGAGKDDAVIRAALGQATRLFGPAVDYCVVVAEGLSTARVRTIMEWAVQPVEYWRMDPEIDNPRLARALTLAKTQLQNYGYWNKWFPERVRPNAPEWILDADMLITKKPSWFDSWVSGNDTKVRITQEDHSPGLHMYTEHYVDLVDMDLRLYSGLISLPANFTYMHEFLKVMEKRPLKIPHNGKWDMGEQGVMAIAFQTFKPQIEIIPLNEFPFCRAFQNFTDFGNRTDKGVAWGYHFGRASTMVNTHFTNLTKQGVVFSLPNGTVLDVVQKTAWLGATTQWGTPGWSLGDELTSHMTKRVYEAIARTRAAVPPAKRGKNPIRVLELGTSRGRMALILHSILNTDLDLITVDLRDRGAAANLAGLPGIRVVRFEASAFLKALDNYRTFDLVIVDMHGNGPAEWARLGPLLLPRVAGGGTLLVNNARLFKVKGWGAETGVKEFLENLQGQAGWQAQVDKMPLPGLGIVIKNSTAAA